MFFRRGLSLCEGFRAWRQQPDLDLSLTTEPARKVAPPEKGSESSDDRWGVKRAENLITSLKGVLSARVVATNSGAIDEIHVFTNGSVAAKQAVRNVESALFAQLGLKVDHRKISVAQTAEVSAIQVLEEEAVKTRALRREVVFQHLDIYTTERRRVKFQLTLQVDGNEVVAEQEAADTPKARVQAAARVAVTALDQLLPEGTIELEGVKQVEAFGTEFAFVGVHVLVGRKTKLLTGSCEVTDGFEQAAALAALDATNRWTQSLL